MIRAALALLCCAAQASAAAAATATYVASGRDVALFDQYDIDGFSVEVRPCGRLLCLTVRAAGDEPESEAAYRPAPAPRQGLVDAADRDALVADLVSGARREEDAVSSIFDWIEDHVQYDADRRRPQDPGSVFASKRAYCIGFAELAVDLLRRAGISAETVQGVLAGSPGEPGYQKAISGAYHRWVRIFYPDRGWRFADPLLSRRGAVDARYVPFARRAWSEPSDLRLRQEGEVAR